MADAIEPLCRTAVIMLDIMRRKLVNGVYPSTHEMFAEVRVGVFLVIGISYLFTVDVLSLL